VIFLSVGFPGRFAAWCEGVVAQLVGALGGSVSKLAWPSIEELTRIWPIPGALEIIAHRLIEATSDHLVVGLHQPDDRLLAALSAAGVRFLVALDDPRAAVADILAETGSELGLATRAVANCCPLIMQFVALPGALALHANAARADPGAAVVAIAGHLGLNLSRPRTRRIAERIAASELTRALASAPAAAALSTPAQRVVDGALAGYAELFGGGVLDQIVWRREIFILHSEGFVRPTGIIDVAGPPRVLIYGPYIHLPPGRWSARIILGVSPDAAGNSFLIDAFADTRQLGHSVLVPTAGGVHAADIDFSLDEPSAKGLEIRVLVTNQKPRGRLALGQVVLQLLAVRQPDAFSGSEAFEAVLDL